MSLFVSILGTTESQSPEVTLVLLSSVLLFPLSILARSHSTTVNVLPVFPLGPYTYAKDLIGRDYIYSLTMF